MYVYIYVFIYICIYNYISRIGSAQVATTSLTSLCARWNIRIYTYTYIHIYLYIYIYICIYIYISRFGSAQVATTSRTSTFYLPLPWQVAPLYRLTYNRFRSVLQCVLQCRLTYTHTHANTHAHTLSFSLSLFLSFCLSFSLTHTHKYSPSLSIDCKYVFVSKKWARKEHTHFFSSRKEQEKKTSAAHARCGSRLIPKSEDKKMDE